MEHLPRGSGSRLCARSLRPWTGMWGAQPTLPGTLPVGSASPRCRQRRCPGMEHALGSARSCPRRGEQRFGSRPHPSAPPSLRLAHEEFAFQRGETR